MALDALFRAPGSEDAVYLAISRSPVAVRTIRGQRWMDIGTVRSRPSAAGEVFNIRRSEIEQPAIGDAIIADGTVYELPSLPEMDAERLTWIFDVPKLERTITILRAGSEADAYGDAQTGYTELPGIAAARLDRTGTEAPDSAATGNQVVAWRGTTFFVTWSEAVAGITPRDRVSENGVIYDIHSIAEIGDRVGLEMAVTARAS